MTGSQSVNMWEIVIPHELERGPLVGVRRMLVLSSIAELKDVGLYDRYCACIDSRCLTQITEMIGPGWMPVELAKQHYEACDRLPLSDAQIEEMGVRAGDKMSSSLLVAGAQGARTAGDRDPWELVGAYSRMGRRIYEGSSSQYVKVAPNKLLIEHVGNPLFAIRYFRTAHASFMRGTFRSLGVDILDLSYSAYRPEKPQIEARLTWK
jgi:hypothetical protein